jgi:hypothetical protein
MLPEHFGLSTNCTVTGTSQSGKSKFSEHCIRRHILNSGTGVCVIDWHGTLYESLVGFLAYVRPKRPVYLIDPSSSEYVVPYKPFALPVGRERSSHVNRLVSKIVKPWGETSTNELPTYERIAKMIFTFMATTGEPLQHAAKLLEFPKRELREYAIAQIEDNYARQQWKTLQYVHALREWNSYVLSTENRLGRFLSSKSVIRFMGIPRPAVSIADCIRENAIVLVNLAPSDYLDEESAKVFAALLLSDFLDAAQENAKHPRKYFLYLDECQNYLTNDAAKILDQTLKGGLRVTLIHHHMGQFFDKPHLRQSLRINARIQVVFGGLPAEEAKPVAEDLFFAEANQRWCKEERYRYVTEYDRVPYEIETTSWGDNSGSSSGHTGENDTDNESSGYSFSSSTATGTRLEPRLVKERDGQEDWNREEKIAQLAERLTALNQGECYIKMPRDTIRFTVPWLTDYARLLNSRRVLEYKHTLLSRSNAIPSHEADLIIQEAEARFLGKGKDYASIGKSRPIKKRPLSAQ